LHLRTIWEATKLEVVRRSCILFISVLLETGCSHDVHNENDAASKYFDLQRRFLGTESSWVEADIVLLSQTCRRLTPAVLSRLQQTNDADAISAYSTRKSTCAGLATTRASEEGFLKQADTDNSGDAFEELDRHFEELRVQTDAAIQSFPTGLIRETSYQTAAGAEFKAKHSALATQAGQIAVEVVTAARTASGEAMDAATDTKHDLDSKRAHLADDAYTQAASELQDLQNVTSAPDVMAKVVEILSSADGAIGSAQRTASVGENPVSAADEALPSVAPASIPPEPQVTSPISNVSNSGSAPGTDEGQHQENSVREFYSDITQKNYPAAYSMLSQDYKSGSSFAHFQAGYATTVSVEAEPHARMDGSDNVDVVLSAVDLKNGESVSTKYVGYWHVVKDQNGTWLLDEGRFTIQT
jgi:hypothetical protein